MLTSNLALPDA